MCDLAWARDAAYLRARRGWGCGAVLSIGIHAIDAVSWALGRDVVGAAGLTSTRPAEAPAEVRAGACPRSRLGAGDEAEAAGETTAVGVLRLTRGAQIALRISLDGAGDTTSIHVCGGGRSVAIAGGEADPTGGALLWVGKDGSASDRARLEALERETRGAIGSPLLVPYLGDAIAALREGEVPGESERLPSIATTYTAHAAAIQLSRASEQATPVRVLQVV